MFVWSNDLKRFIRYLYEYEKDKRIRNVGFIKIETGCEETIVHLQAKGFHDREERKLVLYLFYMENDSVVRILQNEIYLTSPALSWHYTFSVEDVGGEEVYNKICGVFVETGSGRRMAATWDDRCVDVSRIRESVAEYETVCAGCQEESNGQTDQEELDDAREEKGAECQERNTGRRLTRILRQDISKLPRCEWKLANNKFLMHGYNNYHHLLLIDEGNHLKLGVPGIYHIEEAKCAEAFGFREFISVDEQENFGYWCRPVRGRIHMIEEKL